ncbi:MAG: ABC transporter ATP-binding protein [Acidimicrobiia bacterium]
MALLQVDELSVEFATGHGWDRVVREVSFHIDAGETLGLVGESGSGKSVTCLAMTGLIPTPPGRIAGGRALLEGRDLVAMTPRELADVRGDRVSMIFQEPMTSLNPAFTVGEQIAELVRRHRRGGRTAARHRAIEMLERVGIPNAAQRSRDYPHAFSGGMRQRVMIAMALACGPRLLIADEPTTALDVTIQAQMLDLIREMQREEGMAVLFITHDLGVVADICDRVVVLYAGQVVERAGVRDLFYDPRHPYTEGLLSAMPQVGARSGRLASIPGSTPVPSAFPPGCAFAARCPYVIDRCREAPVPLTEAGASRQTRCVRSPQIDFVGAGREALT